MILVAGCFRRVWADPSFGKEEGRNSGRPLLESKLKTHYFMEGLMKRLIVIFVAVASLAFAASPLLAAQPVSTTAAAKESPAITTLSINSATAAEIEKLPGIGKKSAAAVVAYRTEKGKFKTPKDLLKVKGVGEKTLEKIKNLINFE